MRLVRAGHGVAELQQRLHARGIAAARARLLALLRLDVAKRAHDQQIVGVVLAPFGRLTVCGGQVPAGDRRPGEREVRTPQSLRSANPLASRAVANLHRLHYRGNVSE